MPVQKIDHKKIASELIASVQSIEASELEQREKTIKFKAAAQHYISALYKDGRRFKSEPGEKNRVSLGTAQNYLSRVRSQIEAFGWKHHLLDRDLMRLKKRFPLHADAIAELEGHTATETRLLHKSLVEQLDDAQGLLSKVEDIDFSAAGVKRKVQALADTYPIYSVLLMALVSSDDQQAAYNTLHKALREREALAADLEKLKINHEVMYHLVLPKEDAKSLKRSRSRSLTTKKNSVIAIHYEHYVSRVANMLSNPAMAADGGGTKAIAPLTFAICAATGRRPIEVLIQGEFTRINKHKIKFTGQAKKRFEEERDAERWFYSLVDSELVINALEYLRSMPKVVELMNLFPEQDSFKTANRMVSDRTAIHLNQYARDFFGDKQRTFKDTRGIWTRIAFNTWFEVDPYWRSKDEDVFYMEMLGQQDANVQMHYKPFKIHGYRRDFEPEIVEAGNRLDKLKALDDQMPELARGDAAVQLHNDVKGLIEADANIKISQSLLTKPPINAYRDMVKRYLEICADALEIELVGNRWKPKSIADKPAIMIEVDENDKALLQEKDVEPAAVANPKTKTEKSPSAEEKKPERATVEKPKVGSYKNSEGTWTGEVELGGEVVGVGTADNRGEAQLLAWRRYEEDHATISTVKRGDMWHVKICVGEHVIEELMQKGRKGQAEQAAWAAFKNRG